MQVAHVPFSQPQPSNSDAALRESAKELEAVFLAEMLKSAGFGKTSSEFGGGIGEEQFASFLTQQQAQAFSERGGVGLAEHIFNAMKARQA